MRKLGAFSPTELLRLIRIFGMCWLADSLQPVSVGLKAGRWLGYAEHEFSCFFKPFCHRVTVTFNYDESLQLWVTESSPYVLPQHFWFNFKFIASSVQVKQPRSSRLSASLHLLFGKVVVFLFYPEDNVSQVLGYTHQRNCSSVWLCGGRRTRTGQTQRET